MYFTNTRFKSTYSSSLKLTAILCESDLLLTLLVQQKILFDFCFFRVVDTACMTTRNLNAQHFLSVFFLLKDGISF